MAGEGKDNQVPGGHENVNAGEKGNFSSDEKAFQGNEQLNDPPAADPTLNRNFKYDRYVTASKLGPNRLPSGIAGELGMVGEKGKIDSVQPLQQPEPPIRTAISDEVAGLLSKSGIDQLPDAPQNNKPSLNKLPPSDPSSGGLSGPKK